MIILLYTFTVIAIIFVIAGLWLSFRGQSITYERMSSGVREMRGGRSRRTGAVYTDYTGTRRMRGSVSAGRRAYGRRATFEVERNSWSQLFASLNVTSLWHKGRRVHETPWLGLGIVLLAFLICGMYTLRQVVPNSALILANSLSGANTAQAQAASQTNTSNKVLLIGASKALIRINQVDPNSYSSTQEYNTWWPSTCSAASMTEVINSYGHNYKLSDILHVESGLNEITPDLGLVEPSGIAKTVAKFNFSANYLNNPSLDDVMKAANNGTPVIVSFPPSRWAGGHILVVIGGDNNYVYLADSSRLDMRAMTHAIFMKYWAGFAVIVTPSA